MPEILSNAHILYLPTVKNYYEENKKILRLNLFFIFNEKYFMSCSNKSLKKFSFV